MATSTVVTRSLASVSKPAPGIPSATSTVLPGVVNKQPGMITNEQLNDTLQSLLVLVTKTDVQMTGVTGDIVKIKEDIETIKDVTNESEGLKEQLYSTQGRVVRLEMKNANLEEKILSLECKHYQKDLMFYNVPDVMHQSDLDLQRTVYNTIQHTMKVPSNMIYSPINPTGEIRLDSVIRMGKYKENNTRPILATFLTKIGKNIVNSKDYTKNLKNPIRIRVSEHYPTIIKERRQVQIKHLSQLRTTYENSPTKVILNKDKLFVNGKEKDTFSFQRNILPTTSPASINYKELAHSEPITDKGSTFQAHLLPIHDINQATAAKNAIYQHPLLCKATHLIYAYRIGNVTHMESGFFDDDEVGGGSILMKLLESEHTTNTFIAVTRIKNGPNIGAARFTHIENSAKELLNIEEERPQPLFNYIQFNA